jgi:hypothetical protein
MPTLIFEKCGRDGLAEVAHYRIGYLQYKVSDTDPSPDNSKNTIDLALQDKATGLGIIVTGHPEKNGRLWHIGISNLDIRKPMPNWALMFTQSNKSIENYPQLIIDAPETVTMRRITHYDH